MRFTIKWETETGKGVVKTLPVDIVQAEISTKEKISQGISYQLLTHVLHSALKRAAKRGEIDPLPPYAGWIETLLELETVEDGETGFPTGAASSNSAGLVESAASPGNSG